MWVWWVQLELWAWRPYRWSLGYRNTSETGECHLQLIEITCIMVMNSLMIYCGNSLIPFVHDFLKHVWLWNMSLYGYFLPGKELCCSETFERSVLEGQAFILSRSYVLWPGSQLPHNAVFVSRSSCSQYGWWVWKHQGRCLGCWQQVRSLIYDGVMQNVLWFFDVCTKSAFSSGFKREPIINFPSYIVACVADN